MNNHDAVEGRLAMETMEQGGKLLLAIQARLEADGVAFPPELTIAMATAKTAMDALHDELLAFATQSGLDSGGDDK